MFYNNSDIHEKTHVTAEMREFCQTEECLRKCVLDYFGYGPLRLKQDRCCSSCHPELIEKLEAVEDKRCFRSPVHTDFVPYFHEEVCEVLLQFNEFIVSDYFCSNPVDVDKVVERITEEVEYVQNRFYFNQLGISDEVYMSQLYEIVCKFSVSL